MSAPLPPIKQPLEIGYYWVKMTKDTPGWDIAHWNSGDWYGIDWTGPHSTPAFIGPKIPQYTGAE